ncbi:MAG: hypothetical protein ACTH54_09870, partial [Vagococcus salmoninarum]
HDTHDIGYTCIGKCESVTVDDDQSKDTLTATIKFSCYPFLLTNKTYYDDIWDTINFAKDVLCFSRYDVQGFRELILVNNGSTTISPTIHVTQDMEIVLDGTKYAVKKGYSSDVFLKVKRGINYLRVSGTGKITIFMNKELMA